MNRVAAFCFAAVTGLYAASAGAFCVYNKTPNLNLCVVQTSGNQVLGTTSTASQILTDGGATIDRGVSKWLAPGQNVCCNWKEYSCNTGGKQTDNVSFRIGFQCLPYANQLSLCRVMDVDVNGDMVVTIQAGGWIDVTTDAKGHIFCTGYTP